MTDIRIIETVQGPPGPPGATGATGATSPPSGSASGSLGGTYPSPTVVRVDGAAGNVPVGADKVTSGSSPNNELVCGISAPVRTTDATETTLETFALADNKVTRVDVIVMAVQEGTNNHASWIVRNVYSRNAAGAPAESKTGADTVVEAIGSNAGVPPAGWGAILDKSSNTARVRGTGAVGANIQWTVAYQTFSKANS